MQGRRYGHPASGPRRHVPDPATSSAPRATAAFCASSRVAGSERVLWRGTSPPGRPCWGRRAGAHHDAAGAGRRRGRGPVGPGSTSRDAPEAVATAHAWRAALSGTALPTPAASAAVSMRRRVRSMRVVDVLVTCPPRRFFDGVRRPAARGCSPDAGGRRSRLTTACRRPDQDSVVEPPCSIWWMSRLSWVTSSCSAREPGGVREIQVRARLPS